MRVVTQGRWLMLLGVAVLLCGCVTQSSRPAPRKMILAPSTKAERLAGLPKMLPHAKPALLGRVVDAQWAIEHIGDGVLGPSDFVTRIRLQVPQADVKKWLEGKPTGAENWVPPSEPLPWWITPEEATRAVFVEGPNSSMAGLPAEGVVFVFSATQ